MSQVNLPPKIAELVANYFEVMHFQDLQLFDRVFHKDSALYGKMAEELSLRPYEVYREQVANRKSPAELGNPRRDEVLFFDQLSDSVALVKVQLQMFDGVMQDYLNLVKIDNKWWVLAKVWGQVGTY